MKYVNFLLSNKESIRIPYEEVDFGSLYGAFLDKAGIPAETRKFLVSTQVGDDGATIPLVDIKAPEEYKRVAAAHEFFCACGAESYDSRLGLRKGHHRCQSCECAVLRHMEVPKETIEQRKQMFRTILDHPAMQPSEDIRNGMKGTLSWLEGICPTES